MSTYLVCGSRPWCRQAFDAYRELLAGDWRYFHGDHRGDMLERCLGSWQPRYVFFLHWSAKVSEAITDAYECINFHMTNLPYGRGGTPLQNLLAAGARGTVLTAHRMTSELDAGPVYMKWRLSLEGSTAEEVYLRSAMLAMEMAREIAEQEYEPVPQSGKVTRFTRRTPGQSVLPQHASLQGLHDHIRMLDADGYPPAFIDLGDWHLTFRGSSLYTDRIEARCTIRRRE